MTSNPQLHYPIPFTEDNIDTQAVAAHFRGLKKDPPPALKPAWYVIVLRRMAGQNVDAECAELLQLERQYNAGKPLTQDAPAQDAAPKAETAAQRAFRTFKASQEGK